MGTNPCCVSTSVPATKHDFGPPQPPPAHGLPLPRVYIIRPRIAPPSTIPASIVAVAPSYSHARPPERHACETPAAASLNLRYGFTARVSPVATACAAPIP